MTGLDEIRAALEGVVPSVVATCAPDGTPNVCYLSQVEYVDPEHVALSFQFFNKTRQNVLGNPQATVAVADPETAAVHRLHLRYLRTETHGPVFERMKAKLASIASAMGTTGVFRLQGADIYRVESIERAPGAELPRPPRRDRLAALRACSDAVAAARDLGSMLDALLAGLSRHFGIEHALVLAVDEVGQRFYTLASRGYGASGVGSEIPLGLGAVGVAASRNTPIRLAHAAAEYAYVRAIREQAAADPHWAVRLESTIPFPGLPAPHSQLAVPIEVGDRVLGVLCVESAEQLRFTHEDEDALVVLSRQVALAMRVFDTSDDAREAPPASRALTGGAPLVVRHFAANDSVFLGDEYLIKGVAGAILWKLVRAFVQDGREQFSNRELRLDPSLGLPELADNLEARLVLLERRLRERDAGVSIEKTGRGRFKLVVRRTLELVDAG